MYIHEAIQEAQSAQRLIMQESNPDFLLEIPKDGRGLSGFTRDRERSWLWRPLESHWRPCLDALIATDWVSVNL